MQLEFIANACELFISQGKTLLCDPWLSEGAFEGSWNHWPPIRTLPEDVADFDYLYISHIDPDHFDKTTLAKFDPKKPVIILKFKNDYLKRNLEALGYQNIVELEAEIPRYFGPFKLTLFGPFQKTRLGSEAKVGNVIDSAILIEADGHKVLNTIDNLPSIESAERLQAKYGPFDLVQLNYNSAGPYPDCFRQYPKEKRKLLADEFLVKQLNHFCELACVFIGAKVMPFAGDYVLIGREWEKNFYNGTCSAAYAASFMEAWFHERALKYLPPLILEEGDRFDFKNPGVFPSKDVSDMARMVYAQTKQDVLYPHQLEESFPSHAELKEACILAYQKFSQYRKRWAVEIGTRVFIHTNAFSCDFSAEDESLYFDSTDIPTPSLQCFMDARLLWRLLTRKANWNNAEIGAHIEFVRSPDEYEQDLHLLLNFFHV